MQWMGRIPKVTSQARGVVENKKGGASKMPDAAPEKPNCNQCRSIFSPSLRVMMAFFQSLVRPAALVD